MVKKPLIYFLCTGNSCRSQMAEGFAKVYLGDQYEVRSAGIEAHGVHPDAIEVMKEVGIDISKQQSSHIDADMLRQAALIITLCGDARDRCPTVPTHVKQQHWGLDDPARVSGNKDERLKVFRRVRDEIQKKVYNLRTGK